MKERKFTIAALVLIAAINIYFLITVRICDYNGTNWKSIIYSDGKGYYEYLRAAFINHNLANEDSTLGFIRMADGKPVIKFFPGPAIAYSPFFFGAYAVASINNDVEDGYSRPFQIAIGIAGLVYCLLGLFFTAEFFRLLKIPDAIVAIVTTLITYGTNLFYYAVFEPSMSHVYAFACVAGFIYFSYRYFHEFKISLLIAASIFLALTILIRPTNGVILLMSPFLIGDSKKLLSFLKNYSHLLASIITLSSFIFIQMLFWFLQTGKWIVWSYQTEGFYFSRPAIANFIFSYDKGWFVYTPLALLALVGFFPLWRRSKVTAISILVTLLAAIYLNSAWWCWDYSNSFGMRPMIDFYSIIALLISVLIISSKNTWTRYFVGILLTSILSLSIIQTYQYYHFILQQFGMSKGKYSNIFLKTSKKYEKSLGGNFDLKPYSMSPLILIDSAKNNFSRKMLNWNSVLLIPDPSNSENKCLQFDSVLGLLSYSLPADTLIHSANALYFKIYLRRMELSPHSSSQAKILIAFMNGDTSVFNYEFLLNDYPDQQPLTWRKFNYAVRIRKQFKPYDRIEFQILNPLKQNFLIDDGEIKTYRTP